MGEYTVQKGEYAGLVITTKPVNPSIIQRVLGSVVTPKRPVYEATLAGGRKQYFPMDEVAAEQTPGGKEQWELYREQMRDAQSEQNNKVVNAIFLLGTDCTLPVGGWEELDRMLGLDIPEQPDAKRAHFLMTHLEPSDIIGLTTAVMRETGVDESVIQEAEDSFRDSVRNGPGGPGTVADAIGHQGQNSQDQLAS